MAHSSGPILRDSHEWSAVNSPEQFCEDRGSVLSEMLPKVMPLNTASAWSPVRAQ